MDGRVKTLHPKIHGGILARRAHPEDLEPPRGTHGIGLVDLVVRQSVSVSWRPPRRPGIRFDDLIEQIDIGGPSLVRAAAKNFRDVLVVVSPADYAAVLDELDARADRRRVPLRSRAARLRAHRRLRHGDRLDARRGHGRRRRLVHARAGGSRRSRPTQLVDRRRASCATCATARTRTSRRRGTRSIRRPALGAPAILQGKELSFTNLLDLDAAARIVLEFDEPAACVIKHTNPCGAATGDDHRRGLRARARRRRARRVRRHRRPQPADRRRHRARDRVDVHRSGRRARRWTRRRSAILRAKAEHARRRPPTSRRSLGRAPRHARELRSVLGALLLQQRDEVVEARERRGRAERRIEGRDQRQPTRGGVAGAALCVARHGAREVEHGDLHRRASDARDRRRADEPCRCGQGRDDEGRRLAVAPAPRPLAGTVAASDAFFPFRDGLDAVAAAARRRSFSPADRCGTRK